MDNEAYFNITREATFEKIVFRGDYGMLAADQGKNSYAAKSTLMLCRMNEDLAEQRMLQYVPMPILSAYENAECSHESFMSYQADGDSDED